METGAMSRNQSSRKRSYASPKGRRTEEWKMGIEKKGTRMAKEVKMEEAKGQDRQDVEKEVKEERCAGNKAKKKVDERKMAERDGNKEKQG